ncbi:MAG: hypothetical protein BZY88_19520 [SAR202 cluster bacterium Io17-Chloro-G9]|nr:MAG: hypothetical protein BZY88_19520 [SAR202 cluster bacterium Io17-Chloro-G9]
MKFALFTHLPWPEGTDPRGIFEQATEEVEYGEELGFYSAWLAEHHFSRYGLGSSSLVLAGSMAARTKTIRMGTAVLVPPLHHPVRLAEDTATVDAISGGRLDVGFGRGTANYEYSGLNVVQEESQGMFQESIGVIKGLWTTPDFSHKGRYFQVDQTTLVPPTVQKPYPPIYLAATRTQATLEYAVSTGHPLMVGVVQDTPVALDLCRRFVTLSQESGHNVPMSQIPFFRYLYVAASEDQARKDSQDALNWTLDMAQWRRTFTAGSEVNLQLEDWRNTRSEQPPSYDYLFENRAIIGTPDQCIAKIKDLQRQGIDYFGCNFSFGGLEHKKLLRSMDLFSREVMPHFK